MLFKTKIFKRIKGFDKNIFLYYEDNDYFTKCRINKLKLYTVLNAYFYHKKKEVHQQHLKILKRKIMLF